MAFADKKIVVVAFCFLWPYNESSFDM